MKIGIFDSGLGGLLILKSIVARLPQYDYLYIGDTKRAPYGNRSHETIYELTKAAVAALFRRGCALVIIACNTASVHALKKIQREYLPARYPARRALGVIVPTAEETVERFPRARRVGVLATYATVASEKYIRELHKRNPRLRVVQQAAPLLVPLIENDGVRWAGPILREYLKPLLRARVNAVILGCTHYPVLKHAVRRMVPRATGVIAQDEFVPRKLAKYLARHPEIDRKLSRRHTAELFVTDITPYHERIARQWFGNRAALRAIRYRA